MNLVVGGPLTILDQKFASSSCDPLPSFAPLFSPYTYGLVNLEDVMNENDPFLKPFCPLSNPNH
jgi:hypothetical protein